MPRTCDRPNVRQGFGLLALAMMVFSLSGCAVTKGVQQQSTVLSPHLERDVEKNAFPVPAGNDVIGRLASIRVEKGDTLPDIARHFSLGVNALSAANPEVDVWVPKTGERVLLPLSFILPDTPRKGIVVNLATMRLFHFKGGRDSMVVSTYPVGVGMEERPTPTGRMHVERKATLPTWHVPSSIAEDHMKKGDPLPAQVPPGPQNPLGEYALYLSKQGYLIHGTNKPASIGLKATNGCLRLYPENVKMLFDDTPVNTPVAIVNQPYLVGQRNGVIYLEAHKPLEDSDPAELKRTFVRLKHLQRKSGRNVDWQKVKAVLAEARGIPVAVTTGDEKLAGRPTEIAHPAILFGRPEIPELKMEAWYVMAASVREETEAERIAAIINHQGPHIPARVLARKNGYRVLVGPFSDINEAKDASRRLKVDLEMEGILVEPARMEQSPISHPRGEK